LLGRLPVFAVNYYSDSSKREKGRLTQLENLLAMVGIAAIILAAM